MRDYSLTEGGGGGMHMYLRPPCLFLSLEVGLCKPLLDLCMSMIGEPRVSACAVCGRDLGACVWHLCAWLGDTMRGITS